MEIAGTFSRGTLKVEHLLKKFVNFANRREVQKKMYPDNNRLNDLIKEANYLLYLMQYAEELDYEDDLEIWTEQASQLWGGPIFEILNELAPENHYFGTLTGDGSHFGFWRCQNEETVDKSD